MKNPMNYIVILLLLLIPLVSISCGGSYAPLPTVNYVDANRYLGKWYEIARLPNKFQSQCEQSIAEYSLLDSETIRVVNRCRQIDTAKSDEAQGKAFIVPNTGNAKLKVQFFWPFKGDYWIIALDTLNYQYSMVGEPGRKYLWILSRNPKLEPEIFSMLKKQATEQGFDVTKLIVTNSGSDG